jgi:hypothetical protein
MRTNLETFHDNYRRAMMAWGRHLIDIAEAGKPLPAKPDFDGIMWELTILHSGASQDRIAAALEHFAEPQPHGFGVEADVR